MPGIKLLLSLTLFLSINGYGTTFVETSLKDRLRIASGVVKGEYLGESYKKLPSGQIVTEATFRILESSGIKSSEIVNHNNFKVLLPGGVWQGRVFKVSGVPKFKTSEITTLVLKKSEFGYVLPNLAMSKYDLKIVDNEKFLVSEIFSHKEGVGRIKLEKFNQIVYQTFGSALKGVEFDKYVSKGPDEELSSRGRGPASKNKKEKEDDSIPVIWFVIGLGFLGFVPTLLLKGKRNEN